MSKRALWIMATCRLGLALLFAAGVQAEDCAFFYEDFSESSPHSWSYYDATWMEQSGKLSVSQIQAGWFGTAETVFYTDALYQIDVDLEVLDAGTDAGFGIYTFTRGDAVLDVGGSFSDGIAAMVYPGKGAASLMAWDVLEGKWYESNVVSIAGPITSVGFALYDSQAVLRVNRQNTAAVFQGTFSFAPWVVDTLWLMAQGTGTQARFDNVCADVPGTTPPPAGEYDGIWKNAAQTMNFYIQTYVAGSALVIATADLQTFHVFLDPDFSNGIDVGDLAGGGHHLTLSFSSSSQASAVLTPSGSGPQSYPITKHFGTPSVTTHDGIWKSPDCQAGTLNYYVQSYDTGAGIVIATADLSTLYVFLDPDLSNGMDVGDLAGAGAHLTLSLSGGQGTAMARCFAAPQNAGGGTPAASCSLTGMGPNPNPKVITGPGGSSIELTDDVIPGKPVTLSSADPSEILEAGETSVSGVVRVSVGGDEGPLSGDGFFKVSLPVTGPVSNAAHLTLKTRLSTGLVLPVHGEYDAVSKTYTAELAGLYDGWVFGVVIQPDQVLYPDTGSLSEAAWQTEYDWKTFAWHVVDSSNALTEVNVREIQSAAKAVAQTLSNALFRGPKLWVSTTTEPHARLIHNVAGKVCFNQPGTEESANFSLVSRTEQEMLALGRLYLDYNAIKTSLAAKGITLGHVVIHEMLHAVQAGYDVRVGWDSTTHSLKPYWEGTAVPVGQSYQDNNGSISGPSASVRKMTGGGDEFAFLNRAVDDYTHRGENKDYYSKQDFFVYVTRMYNHNDWSYLGSLFQDLYTATLNKFGRTMATYRKLYRAALSEWVSFWTSRSLSEVYCNYAVDRTYKHPAEAVFRESEAFVPNKLAASLFTADTGYQTLDETNKRVEFDAVEPLSCYAVKVVVPESYKTETESKLPLSFSLTGGELGAEAVRMVIFRENDQGVMLSSGGEMYLTDISKPVEVSVSQDVPTLTILIMNGYVEDKTVKVALELPDPGIRVWLRLVFESDDPDLECIPRLIFNSDGETPIPLTWNENRFSGTYIMEGEAAAGIEGEVSEDRSALLFFEYETYVFPVRLRMEGLPLTSEGTDYREYGAEGAAVTPYITDFYTFRECEESLVIEGDTHIRIRIPK